MAIEATHYEQAMNCVIDDMEDMGDSRVSFIVSVIKLRAAELARAEAMRKWQKVADQDDEDDCKIANALARAEDKEKAS